MPIAQYNQSTPDNSTGPPHFYKNDLPILEVDAKNVSESHNPPPPMVLNQPSPAPPPTSLKLKTGVVGAAAIGAGVLLLIIIIIFLILYLFRVRKIGKKKKYEPVSSGNFTFKELEKATSGFSATNIIGEGGFGFVYKGVLPPYQTEVAVKRLKPGSAQGEQEFQVEVDLISVRHSHLASLLGFCIHGAERLLVYPFVPNQTLHYHLRRKNGCTIDWRTRMKIAVGSAKGLVHLHEECHPRIIHRDIKSSNVLIDDNFEAQVSDFGLAKVNIDNHSQISTQVKGSFGYLDPEYYQTRKLTLKSDVYSFGVLLLELITGKGPVGAIDGTDKSVLEWARPLLNNGLEGNGDFGELVDPFLQGNYNSQEMKRVAICVVSSIDQSSIERPKMSQILRALEEDISTEDLKKEMIKSPRSSSERLQMIAKFLNFKKLAMSSLKSHDGSKVISCKGDEPSIVSEV